MSEMAKKQSSRILTFDLLRGWFLVAILLDHLQYFPNGLDILTGRGQLYVSAAEGFFLISGIVLGIVRGRKLIEKPFKVAAALLVKRGIHLYIAAVVLFFLFTFIGWFFIDNPGVKPGIRPVGEDIWSLIKGALTFDYIYGWADYLRLYAVYLLASPLAIWLLRKKLWYVLLAISLGIWTLFDFMPLETPELSQMYSWQLIFFGGMIIGFYLDPIREWWQNRSKVAKRWLIGSIVVVAAITALANYILTIHGDAMFGEATRAAIDTRLQPYLNKERLPLPRIALFLAWFIAAFWLFHKYEKIIMRRLSWLLMPFGTNSLYVYIIEAFVIYLVHLLVPEATSNWVVNLALSLGCLAIVWLALRYKFLMKIIPR